MEKKLTPKRAKFMAEYIKTGHVTNSAIAAGYSKKTAYSIGSEILNKPEFKAKIEKIMSEEADKLGITVEYILSGLKKWADTDSEKLASQSVKSLELLGRHRKIFHENEVDVTLKEHRETIRQLEDLE